MKKQVSQPDFGPSEWDIDFSFDLDLNLFDYFLVALYLVFIAPILFLFQLAQKLFRSIKSLYENRKNPQQEKAADAHGYGLLSMIAKIF